MKKEWSVKTLAFGIVVLFIGVTKNVQGCDCDDPPCWPELSGEMGDNNWYVSFVVFVTFNGTFDCIYYRINGNDWINYTAPFKLIQDGIHLLEWTCDCNMSNIYSKEIKKDSGSPYFSDGKVKWLGLFKWQFSLNAYDDTSGVNRVYFSWTNSYVTEPPYQVIWRGCYWLYLLRSIGSHDYGIDIYDNAGNHFIHLS